jgi:hypothetical protein
VAARAAARRIGLRQSRRWGAPERLTAVLGAAAVVTFGAAIAAEAGRIFRRASEQALEQDPDTETLLAATPQATSATAAAVAAGYRRTPQVETALFNLLTAYGLTFALVRLSTWGIRDGWWPLGNVSLFGRHIHHFVPGILLAFASGGGALVTKDPRKEQLLAIPFGVGLGLTFDEFALLLDLEDVYWTREGLVSVQISLGLAALLGAITLGQRLLRRGEAAVLDPTQPSA